VSACSPRALRLPAASPCRSMQPSG
jgi:hypothetical protein